MRLAHRIAIGTLLLGTAAGGMAGWSVVDVPVCNPLKLGGCGLFDVGLAGWVKAFLRMLAMGLGATLGMLPGLFWSMYLDRDSSEGGDEKSGDPQP